MVNVKVHNWPHLDISDKANGFAWNAACEAFWRDIQEVARELWPGYDVTVYSEGRMGGWAVVSGLPDVDEWNGHLVAKWGKFSRICGLMIKDLTDPAYLLEEIEANRWNEPGAEQYNFLERADGATVCISEMKAQAIEAGFGPVVRY